MVATRELALDVALLQRNAETFSRVLDIAEVRLRRGRYQSAAEWCRVAAGIATTNPTGELRSARLERVVDEIASHALAVPEPIASLPGAPLRVLHVVTEAASIGGVTRLAERWIRTDATSRSSVVVVRQATVIRALAAAAAESGGRTHALGSITNALEQATALRGLAADADIVIAHVNPDDHVTALAFGRHYAGPPVAVFNHTDHLFSLAPTHATLFVDFRTVGTTLARVARGYSSEVMHEMPLLVPDIGKRAISPTSRTDLGLPASGVLAITVARGLKYRDTPLQPRFAELIAGALDACPQLAYCAVGPSADEAPWPQLIERYGERIAVTGPVADPSPYLRTADLYLDTFPFSSLTSMLEGAAAELPVLTLDSHQGLRRSLGIGDFAPTDADRPPDVQSYYSRLAELVDDPEERAASGRRARAVYDALTPEAQWLRQANGLYERLKACSAAGHRLGETTAPATDARVLDYNLATLAVGDRTPLLWIINASRLNFDGADRAQLAVRTLAERVARKVASITLGTSRHTYGFLLPVAPKAQTQAGSRSTR